MRTSGYVDSSGTVRCDRCAKFMGLVKGSPILADDLAYESDTCADCHRPLSMLVRAPFLASRAAWHVKTAHAVALLLVGASLAAPVHAATVDPFPVAAVAEERESHALSVTRPGHPTRCIAYVSTRDDDTVFVTFATVDGRPLTFPHGPYPSETVGMLDMVGAFGRGC